jgi:quercetin dioxygenase-like cupin family protein
MTTSDIKCETLIRSGFPALNRFRLKVHEVVMEPGDYPEHTHEGPGLRIVHDGAIEITQQGKTNRYLKGDYFFEAGHIPHTVKVPGPAAFHALYVEILRGSKARVLMQV